MSWLPWKRRNNGEGRHRVKEGAVVDDSQDLSMQLDEAQKAKARADRALRDTLDRTPEVERVSHALQYFEGRNQFSEMMLLTYRRKQT